jgi:hypothetical protein
MKSFNHHFLFAKFPNQYCGNNHYHGGGGEKLVVEKMKKLFIRRQPVIKIDLF